MPITTEDRSPMADPGPPTTAITPPDPRVVLAAERTLLAWIRTGLALIGLGFVIARFGWFLREMAAVGQHLPEFGTGTSLWVGTGLVAMGVWVLLGSTLRYRRFLRALDRGDTTMPGAGLGTVLALMLAAIGLAMVAYLIVMGN